MKRIFVFLQHPWGFDVVRDVTNMTRAKLDTYDWVTLSKEFELLDKEARANNWSAGKLLATWVEQVGRERAGVSILRRRIYWINAGGAAGLLFSPVIAVLFEWWPIQSAGWLLPVVVIGPVVLGMMVGAGAGWFLACTVEIVENFLNRRRYLAHD
jgi:hypothetical protein